VTGVVFHLYGYVVDTEVIPEPLFQVAAYSVGLNHGIVVREVGMAFEMHLVVGQTPYVDVVDVFDP
jgi:hypothetical protein